MNEEDLLCAVGQIGDDLIAECERKRVKLRKIAVLAACLALVIAAAWTFFPQKSSEIRFVETEITRSTTKLPYPEGVYDRPMTEESLAAFLGVESFADWGDEVPSGWVHYYADGTVWLVDINVGEGFDWMRVELVSGEIPPTDLLYDAQPQPQECYGIEITAIGFDKYREAWGLVDGAEVIGLRIKGLGENAEDRINRYAALILEQKNTLSLDGLADRE